VKKQLPVDKQLAPELENIVGEPEETLEEVQLAKPVMQVLATMQYPLDHHLALLLFATSDSALQSRLCYEAPTSFASPAAPPLSF